MIENKEKLEDFENILDDLDDDNSIEPNKIDSIPNSPYPTKVNFSRSTPTVFALCKQYFDRKTINLAPAFQREKVWTRKQNSELIESILMGIPLPIMYFFEDQKGNIQVVDGKQRLNALFEFMKDDGDGYSLSDLTILKELKGKKFKDLEPYQRANIEDYELVVNIIKPPTPDRIKFDIFDRVNRGGTRLNNQEMRNAIYQGKSTELLDRLSSNEWFQKAISKSISSKFMKDKYIILRALAFTSYKKGNFKESYNSDIDDFLGKFMKYLNSANDTEIKGIEENFINSMRNSVEVLPKDAFRVSTYTQNHRRTPISMALFESLAYLMSFDKVSINGDKTGKKVKNIMQNSDFRDSITSPVDSSVKVNKRFDYMDKILEELNYDN